MHIRFKKEEKNEEELCNKRNYPEMLFIYTYLKMDYMTHRAGFCVYKWQHQQKTMYKGKQNKKPFIQQMATNGRSNKNYNGPMVCVPSNIKLVENIVLSEF